VVLDIQCLVRIYLNAYGGRSGHRPGKSTVPLAAAALFPRGNHQLLAAEISAGRRVSVRIETPH
jgi:hypothetical protein